MMKSLRFSLFFLGALLVFPVMAQGPLQEELLLTKPYLPSVNDAVKLDQLPGMMDTATIRPNFNYSVTSRRLDGPLSVRSMGAEGLQSVKTPELNIGYLRLGVGTYRTPAGELALNTRQKDKYSAGLTMSHLSSDGKVKLDNGHRVFAGFSDNNLSGYMNSFFKDFSLSGDVSYRRLVSYAYGYDPYSFPEHLVFAQNDIRSIYQMGDLNVSMRSLNKKEESMRYSGTLGLRNTSNDVGGRERQLLLAGDFRQGPFGMRYTVDLLDRNNDMMQEGKAAALGMNMFYLMTNQKMRFEAGLKPQLFKESGDNARFRLYPVAEFQYSVVDHLLIPFAGLNGGIRSNSYRTLIEENPNLISGYNSPTYTDIKYNIYGGMKGSFGSKAQYYLRASYSSVANDYVFLNLGTMENFLDFLINDEPLTQNYFATIGVDYKVLTLGTDLFVQPSKNFDITLKGTYFKYHTKNLPNILGKPDFEASMVARYVYQSKWSVQVDVSATGNRYFMDFTPDAPDYQAQKRLDGAMNFGLLSEYFVNNRLSVFLKLSNFTTSKYYKWMYYPVQRFQVMGGVTFVF